MPLIKVFGSILFINLNSIIIFGSERFEMVRFNRKERRNSGLFRGVFGKKMAVSK